MCVVVSGAKFFVKKSLSALREWVFPPATGLQENEERIQKHWKHWGQHNLDFQNTLFIDGPVSNKKVNRLSPLQTKKFRSTHSF